MKFILILVISTFSIFSEFTKNDIIGVWSMVEEEEINILEFLDDGSFQMKVFTNNNGLDTVEINGAFLLKEENILLMKIGDMEEYLEHILEEVTDSTLIIRYKEEYFKYKK